MASRHAITGHYINYDVIVAMYRAMFGTANSMVAILRVMVCKIRHVEEDYQGRVAMDAAVNRDAITRNVMVQGVMPDCQR